MNLSFVFREAFRGLGRNITMTIALVITTAISLALLATGFLVTGMTERTKEIYLDRVEVMVQLDEEISANDTDCSTTPCREVRELLEGAEGVESVTFRSREQSYQRFVEVFQDSDPLLVQETSPDALPAAVHVRLTDPLNTTPLDPVRDLPQVTAVVDQVDDLRGATDNLDAIRNATFLFAGIQAVAAIFLIVNMVQIAAFNRREEISIMRMVGASRWYTQAPFVLEAIVATLVGAVLSGIALFAGKAWVVDKTLDGLYSSQLIARISNTDIWAVLPVVALVGIIFSALTAQATLRWYVRK
ncbi:permease-like cell division protein FtsX [Corynebacterium sp. 153RC1]|uniref:permease-like cell division protein FtsX n=1 Tax=unclassified Corynebacterium TaxID=2624378 RepID=UPI00211C4783|nr:MULTISPECIES: permease-like cell division protein FtsX [unclassified Corynebacterium]MCQ9370921.1 permease-like cell division protein FtsX [Corynebacterium sp. 35RC1]MCQ9353116.1 permease-like cell division protein FtsX [Corynebacterium sp. 209RC1]MCQ9355320.1 permease-like cell division protein FtsX [Corynebacterium sp. 1222RC1]MCQ9357607.1 permease-like cell division protein FtsX [Corynebacterium sp. 122RC1]MCQ9359217.1 permease-like cell division protein FtsX [Corynebacterium sp. 142RC1]